MSYKNLKEGQKVFFIGELLPMELIAKTDNTTVEIDGIAFNNIIAKAKNETYAKYPKQKLQEAILKTEI